MGNFLEISIEIIASATSLISPYY